MTLIAQIFAVNQYNEIGRTDENTIPWRCSEDLKFFRKMTVGNIVIMGRKTYESLGSKPLKDRINIVISSTKKFEDNGVISFSSISEAILYAKELAKGIYALDAIRNTSEPVIFIIGGGQLYHATKDIANCFICSRIISNEPPLPEDVAVKVEYFEPKSLNELVYDGYGEPYVSPKDPTKATLGVVEVIVRNEEVKNVFSNLNFEFDTEAHKRVRKVFTNLDYDNEAHVYFYDYDELVRDILEKRSNGKDDRTGVGCVSVFGRILEFNVEEYAPFISKRKLPLKSTLGELLWFLNGDNNVDTLKDKFKCNFWDEWASENTRTIGPMYGYLWRQPVDQIDYILNEMVNNPTSRRMVVDCWRPEYIPTPSVEPSKNPDIGKGALAPCHFSFQVNIVTDEDEKTHKVSLMWNQRSADVLLGLPVNIASYYFLLCILCKAAEEMSTNGYKYVPSKLLCSLGDAHLYKNHLDLAKVVNSRSSLPLAKFTAPDGALDLLKSRTLEKALEYQQKAFNNIENYVAHANLKIPRNV